jgi:hypothetical protein
MKLAMSPMKDPAQLAKYQQAMSVDYSKQNNLTVPK